MYSWKTIRVICAVLLLLPLAHLSYLMSRHSIETRNPSPDAWAREIEAYAAADLQAYLPANPIVVVGGLRVRLWTDLGNVLAPQPVLMRSLGDAIVEDITFNYERLIGFYRPDTVVLLPGHSEFHVRADKSAQDLVRSIQELATRDAAHGVTRLFYVFAPIKTPLHAKNHALIGDVIAQLRTWTNSDDRLVLLDANTLLADTQGNPKARYFRSDGVNLNEHGYLRLSVLLQSQIEADMPSTQKTAGIP